MRCLLVTAISALLINPLVAEEYAFLSGEKQCAPAELECGEAACDPDAIFGPRGQTRGTLFQWPGSTATGGPDLDAPLVTDRPDFTEASSTVGNGVVQLEMGYTFTQDNEGGRTTSHTYPEMLARIGILADWLELRVAWTYTEGQSPAGWMDGADDLYLGFKIALFPQDNWLPEVAIIPQATVPTGSNAITSDEFLPGVNLIYAWDCSDTVSIAGSTQVNRAVDGTTGNTYAEFAQSATIGISLAENVGMYTEWYAFFPHGADTAQVEHYINGGITLLIGNDIQWDVRVGFGLNNAADDFFVGTGLSIRFR